MLAVAIAVEFSVFILLSRAATYHVSMYSGQFDQSVHFIFHMFFFVSSSMTRSLDFTARFAAMFSTDYSRNEAIPSRG